VQQKRAGGSRGGKRTSLTAGNKEYVDFVQEIGRRMEEASSHSARMFLLSLLPAMKAVTKGTDGRQESRSKKPFNVLQLQNFRQ
jgi:hypothetical protein